MNPLSSALLLTAILEPAMTPEPQALAMEVVESGENIEVQLISQARRTQEVRYTLEVTGKSTARHRGRTTLAADVEHVISTVRTSSAQDWCAKATIEEEGRAPYELRRGNCD